MTRPAQSQTLVCIPTHRRPEGLARLLDSLTPELAGSGARVIVADNDCGTEASVVVARWAEEVELEAECLPVPEPGVSAVRNALVRAALLAGPQWRWVAMLDDDSYVTPGWYDAMVLTAESADAAVVGGPVLGELPPGAGLVARGSLYAGRPRFPTGPVSMLNGTNNLFVARSVLAELTPPWFDPQWGRTSGEDRDFFKRLQAEGHRMAWCDVAVVVEPTPADRLTARAIFSRSFHNGVHGAQIDARYDGRRAVAGRSATKLAEASARLGKAIVLGRREKAARAAIEGVHNLGRVAGLTGMRGKGLYGGTRSDGSDA